MLPPPKTDWVAHGPKATVAFATAANGEQPARDFLASDDTARRRARLVALMQRMANDGQIWNREQFRKVRGQIWEFKAHQVRILGFQSGPFWMLTNGCVKKTDDLPEAVITRAERIRSEVLAKGS